VRREKMDTKERLREIKGYVELNTIKNADGDEIEFYAVKAVDFEWLIEQVEKAERYEKALKEIQELSSYYTDDASINAIAKQALEGTE
jgi:hypothetical protein